MAQDWQLTAPVKWSNGENCAALGFEGSEWIEAGCDEGLNFFCQKEVEPE